MNSTIKEESDSISASSSSSDDSIKIRRAVRKTSKPGLVTLDSGEVPKSKFSGGNWSVSSSQIQKNDELADQILDQLNDLGENDYDEKNKKLQATIENNNALIAALMKV